MADPWIEPAWKFAAYFGGVGGSVVGVIGGVLGSCSYFVQKGQGRRWILGAYTAMVCFGVACLSVGLYAVATGQPYGIWYPLVLIGLCSSLVFGSLLPVIRHQYRLAEQRKIDAAGLR